MGAKPVRGIGADHPDRQGVREHIGRSTS